MGKAARRRRAEADPKPAAQRTFIERHPLLLLLIATAIALLPFLNKALTIDDPLFVWVAQQITTHPLDPYGFDLNWGGKTDHMVDVVQNPPLTSYVLAFASAVGGWSEGFLHFVFIFFAFAALAGTWSLAQRLGAPPLFAALLTLAMPVFLLSSTNLMSDVAMTASFVWALTLWIRGVDERRDALLWLAMAAAAMAGLFKYFGIAVIPLMIVYAAMKWRGGFRWIVPLALPVAAFTVYEVATKARYGHGHILGAAHYASLTSTSLGVGLLAKTAQLLSFTGGCAIAILFFAPLLARRRWYVAVAVAVVAIAFVFLSGAPSTLKLTPAIEVQFVIFAVAGLGIFTLAGADVVKHRDAASVLLALWVLGTAVFAAFLNWTINGRSLLPLAPAVAILIARHAVGSRAALVAATAASAVIALLVTVSDFKFANAQREASQIILQHYTGDGHTVWFEGHWGFQYYMVQIGGVPFDIERSTLHGMDLYISPKTNTALIPRTALPPHRVVETIAIPIGVPVSTIGSRARAGFYSDFMGPVPYAFGPAPDEIFEVLRLGRS